MFTHERHQLILDLLSRQQRLTITEIQEQFDVSPATLRRDLTRLEEAGALVRVHGGVVHPQALRGEPSFLLKSGKAVEAKQAIAEEAARRVPDGTTVYVDAGTTCLEIGKRLLARKEIRLVTNSVPLLHEAAREGVAILSIGGELRPISGALTGLLSRQWLERLEIGWAFIGASGLSPAGVATTELSEAAVKTDLLHHAAHRVLAADASKWGEKALVRFAKWREFHLWLTAGDLPTLPEENFPTTHVCPL